MVVLRCDAVLPYKTGLPRDVAVNTFHFQVEDPDVDLSTSVIPVMTSFYNDPQVDAINGIAWYLSDEITRDTDGCDFRFYTVGTEGPPIAVIPWTLENAGNTTSLPFECACCLSYASNMTGVVRARQRGRIYLGPLTTATMTTHTGAASTITSAFVHTATEAGYFLAQNETLLAVGVQWVVYSRTNNAAYPIVSGYVDNEFDTQRRRQVDATARETFSVL